MRVKKEIYFFVLFFAAGLRQADACTTTITTKGASADGSMLVSHSDDGHLENDSSIVFVPRYEFSIDGARDIYPTAVALDDMPQYNAFLLPRIQEDTGPEAYRHPELPRTKPVGQVPYKDILSFLGDTARRTTYSYLDGSYGINNEWGLMFGECTNGSKATTEPVPNKKIFYSTELSHIALEHCKTARDAVRLIGHLVDVYGYWGTGETLPIADLNEAWVLEIAPVPADYEKAGGLWVAQKVPDGEFFIAANEFRIREVDPAKRGDSLLYGDALFAAAKDLGWWTESDIAPGIMDWLPTVSLGEYSHPYYSLRRVWRGLSLVAPSLKLEPWIQDGKKGLTRQYPFSVKPDKKLSTADIRALHRDYYQGTEFDLTRGIAAGPWGNPNRYLGTNDPGGDVGDPNTELPGAWERPIGVYYTNITYINQNWSNLPNGINTVSWIALNAPVESVFVPLAVAPPPAIYETMDSRVFNIEGQAWRIYNLVGEYVNLKYNYMMRDVSAAQKENEERGENLIAQLHKTLSDKNSKTTPEEARALFNKELNLQALSVHGAWRALFERLVVNYNQGDVNTAAEGETPALGKTRYPDYWLEASDYYRGPTIYAKKRAE